MTHLQQYVPVVEYTEEAVIPTTNERVEVQRATFHKVFLGGDQLTAARARGAQKIRVNSVSPLARVEGLIPCAEEWHTKLNLLGVSVTVYVSIAVFHGGGRGGGGEIYIPPEDVST